MKPITILAAIIFALISIGHLLRLIFQVPVTVAGITMPVWASMIGALVAAVLAVLLWRESGR